MSNAMILILVLLSAVAAQASSDFDIAKGKKITATATCGEGYEAPDGSKRELFCTLADAEEKFGIRGLQCSYCEPGVEDEGKKRISGDHNIKNAIDGSNKWWQSPPLSRGLQYREVNVTIDLGQVSDKI